MYPPGISPPYPGGRTRYRPPLPWSAPAGPTSSSGICQQSMIDPTMVPSSAGGMSSTIGPAWRVLTNGMTYSASVFGVSSWVFPSASCDQYTSWFSAPCTSRSSACRMRSKLTAAMPNEPGPRRT
jgi:hypothetical protein